MLAGEVPGTGRVNPLYPAEAEDFPARALLDDPESVPIIALEPNHPLKRGAPLFRRLHAAEMLHHLWPVHHGIEWDFVFFVPFAKPEPGGLRDDLSHRRPSRRG